MSDEQQTNPLQDGIPRAQLLVRTEFIRSRLAERRRKDPLGYSEKDFKLDNARIDTVVGYCFYEAFSRPLEDIMGNIRITHPLEDFVALSKLEPINLRLYYLDFMTSTYLSVKEL